jgi:hypothetical protein
MAARPPPEDVDNAPTQLNNIFVHINSILMNDDKPSVIYFAIGSAAQTVVRLADGRMIVEEDNYQQFPKFLKDMYKREKMNVFIILIDPCLETPLYIVNDINLNNILGHQVWTHNETFNAYEKSSVYVYPIRRNIKICIDDVVYEADDITESLRNFHELVKSENVFMFYYNYSGINITDIAEFFDRENRDYLQQIIYGFGARQNHGCYVELTSIDAQFAYKIVQKEKRRCIEVFNIFSYIKSSVDINKSVELLNYDGMIDIIIRQIEEFKKEFSYKFVNQHLYFLRGVYMCIRDAISKIEPRYQFDSLIRMNKMLSDEQKYQIINWFNTNCFNIITECLQEIYGGYLQQYQHIFQIKIFGVNVTGIEVYRYITMDPDPYKWIDAFRQLN